MPLSGIRSERVSALFTYWSGKRAKRMMPSRPDIDPAEIISLLPYVALADLTDDPMRVRFRLAGDAICGSHGRNIAWHWLHELDPAGGVVAWASQYARMMRMRAPVAGRLRADPDGVEQIVEWAILPLSADDGRVEQCLQIEDWFAVHRDPSTRRDPAMWRLEEL